MADKLTNRRINNLYQISEHKYCALRSTHSNNNNLLLANTVATPTLYLQIIICHLPLVSKITTNQIWFSTLYQHHAETKVRPKPLHTYTQAWKQASGDPSGVCKGLGKAYASVTRNMSKM